MPKMLVGLYRVLELNQTCKLDIFFYFLLPTGLPSRSGPWIAHSGTLQTLSGHGW